jgi:lipid-A-disaccharide synthase
MPPLKIYIVAAEASGDRLGADLVKALRARRNDISLAGIGGQLMQSEGLVSPFDIAELSVLGLVEGLKAYPRVVKRVRDAIDSIVKFNPDIVVLIDSWGFTIRVAQALRKASSRARIVKYLGPQVWASRPGRAKTLAQAVDHLLCIYDIETPYYAPFNLPCTVVGNPVANGAVRQGDGVRFRADHGLSHDAPLLLVLFGSRPSEVSRLGAVFEETAKRLKAEHPALVIATFAAPTIRESVESLMQALPGALVLTDQTQKEDLFNAATAVLACSGSVTTELALQSAPMVVAYRLGAITWFLAKNFLFKPKYVTLFNIAAGKEIAPELLQGDCTVEKLAPALTRFLTDARLRAAQIAEQNEALKIMGRGKASAADIAADAILNQPVRA